MQEAAIDDSLLSLMFLSLSPPSFLKSIKKIYFKMAFFPLCFYIFFLKNFYFIFQLKFAFNNILKFNIQFQVNSKIYNRIVYKVIPYIASIYLAPYIFVTIN